MVRLRRCRPERHLCGGPVELIEALLASAKVEALSADPSDPVVTGHGDLPGWLADLVEEAVSELMATHRAEMTTARFTTRFELQRRPWRNWDFHYACDGPTQATGGTRLRGKDLPRQLHEVRGAVSGSKTTRRPR